MKRSFSRRELLRGSAATGVGLFVAGNLIGCSDDGSSSQARAGSTTAAPTVPRGGYGKLVPDPDGLLDLPEGFRYEVVSRAGDPLAGGGMVPGKHDGMAAFEGREPGTTVLVVNHEQRGASDFPVAAGPDLTYDPGGFGGTTTVVVDASGKALSQEVSLAGTVANCAGGPTPWGTWLSCEESEAQTDPAAGIMGDHGFVFEVDPFDQAANAQPTPLTGLGRFSHEAVAVDPNRGALYLTEDAAGPYGLLYRFTPTTLPGRRGSLRDGGTLEAMMVAGVPDLSAVTEVGRQLDVTWAPVPDPLAATTPTRAQFADGAITRGPKLEGAWWGRNRAWVVSSFARAADGAAADHDGQVWSYDPAAERLTLEVRFDVNPDPAAVKPDGPDNITTSPQGGLILAEDGQGTKLLVAVSAEGEATALARNAAVMEGGGSSEFAGPVFSPDGKTLFANVQTPGTAFAITGPF